MAGDRGSSADALMQRLRDDPYQFDFYSAVRRLQCARPDLPEVGRSRRVSEDAVRFGQEPSTSFATSTLGGLKHTPGAAAPRLFVNFMGLLGPNGALPIHLADYARQRERNHKDPTFARFLDVFNHRMVSLFFRAWALNQPPVLYERTPEGEHDPFSIQIASMFGLGQGSLRDRDAVPDESKLYFSGRLACQSPHPEGLLAIMREYYKVPAMMEEFSGRWAMLPDQYQCRLGKSRESSSLGGSGEGGGGGMCAMGSRFWDCQGQFRIVIGPMSLSDYKRFLPMDKVKGSSSTPDDGRSMRRLQAWVLNYLGFEYSYQVQLVLAKGEAPACKMTRDPATGVRLGWTTWLGRAAAERECKDLVMTPASA